MGVEINGAMEPLMSTMPMRFFCISVRKCPIPSTAVEPI